jgi:Uma2 family endonuclease
MAAKSQPPVATYADLESLPPHKVGEIVGGVLIVSPRPAFPHAAAASALGEELGPPFKRGRGGPGGWILLDEPELHLGAGPDVLVPHLAGWRRERMPEMPDVPFATVAPDWICEVLSPSTEAVDRGDKLPIYAREGVLHAWLVDPILRTLEVLRLDAGGWCIVGTSRDHAKIRAEPFDAVELDLAVLWAR